MGSSIVEHLRMLRDVQGVYGSFVVAESGSLVDRDLPAAFDESLFADVAPRVARLFETFVSGGKDVETCMLRYAEHKLYVRKMTWGMMAVISSAAVNLPALRMVANLVVRRIDPEIIPLLAKRAASASPSKPTPASVAPSSPPPLPPRRSQAPSEVAAAQVAVPADMRDTQPPTSDRQQVTRMYRGRPVGE